MQHLRIPTAVLLDPDLNTLIAGGGDTDHGPGKLDVKESRNYSRLPSVAMAHATLANTYGCTA